MFKIIKYCAFFAFLFLLLTSFTSVLATWKYAQLNAANVNNNLTSAMGNFIYEPEDMPEAEITVVQRLSDVLNNRYVTDKVTNSMDYLINETIQVYWGGDMTANPYVGSMDLTFSEQLHNLFGDIEELWSTDIDNKVSFLLKAENLVGDYHREIAMYSTSDPLNCEIEFDGIVCVYVTVFTPKLDADGNITGYELLCESLRGYCYEVYYDYTDAAPSFSTNEWHNDVGYYHYGGYIAFVPDDAPSYDGTKLFKQDYHSYNKNYVLDGWWTGRTHPCGKTLAECLAEKIH